ncbi:MAG: hypothetical protein KJT03_17585, partial [Verrucomicrobiae bacterium]|nr:hypothetical protein [Verrucomicrobiae bacterium]
PKSVEGCINRHPAVETCRVIPFDDGKGNTALAAYVVAPDKPSQEDLRQFALRTLPVAVIPAVFVYLDSIPLTRNGKLDRSALPRPELSRDTISKRFVAPETEMEKLVAAVFEELLNVERVGRKDNFFTLGGNSLRTVQLCNRIANKSGKKPSIATVFEYPVVEALARVLDQEEDDQSLVVRMGGKDNGTPLFCLPGITRNPLSLSRMVDQLNHEGPCFGIELPDKKNGVEPFKNMEELSEYCARQVQKTQAHGPYHLSGYSFGGLLAYATACKLLDKGEEVASIVILDSHHRKANKGPSVSRLNWAFKKWFQNPFYYPRYLATEAVFSLGRRFGLFKNSKRFVLVEIFNEGIQTLSSSSFHFGYVPEPRPLRILIFTARNTEFSYTSGNELAQWAAYSTKPVKFVRVQVDHHNQLLLDEHLDFICSQMKAYWEET